MFPAQPAWVRLEVTLYLQMESEDVTRIRIALRCLVVKLAERNLDLIKTLLAKLRACDAIEFARVDGTLLRSCCLFVLTVWQHTRGQWI